MSRKFKVPLGLVALSEPPASPSTGDVYLNTSLGVMVYTGEGWQKTNTPEQVDGENMFYWNNYGSEGTFIYEGGSTPTTAQSQTLDGGRP